LSSVAIATCTTITDLDAPRLLGALDDVGVRAELRAWDDPAVDWAGYDAVVVRSTWDYSGRLDEFLDWARAVARLLNPFEVLEYSADKHYLADLAARGHRVVSTTFCDVGEEPEFPGGDFVVKPAVGAGSALAERYGPRGHDAAREHVAALHALGRDALLQPYVEAVDTEGERALVFIDGAFSHAMAKAAMLNVPGESRDVGFRIRQMSLAEAEPDALALAREVLAERGFDGLCYARVDLVRDAGRWAIMELELVEPWLFLGYDDAAPARLARAIARRAGV
jgi:glutathione synthase/RimK-type ligase-like ATP-grasp enzyme